MMWREIKVLLIDDSAERRQQFQTILNFLGEESVVTDCASWKQAVKDKVSNSNEINAVLLGDCQ